MPQVKIVKTLKELSLENVVTEEYFGPNVVEPFKLLRKYKCS